MTQRKKEEKKVLLKLRRTEWFSTWNDAERLII